MKEPQTNMPIMMTPVVARIHFHQLLERIKIGRERFLIGKRRTPDAVLLGFDDFMELAHLDRTWIDELWEANATRVRTTLSKSAINPLDHH